METFALRRTQSLRSLSGAQERSWVMPAPTRWERKSVSQLVHHYQSCANLWGIKKQEHKLQLSESCVDGRWRQLEGADNVVLWGARRSSNLSRSRSMDTLPQKESSVTKALCALFESKATLQDFSSSPRLNSASAVRDCPLRDGRGHKETSIQRADQVKGKKDMNGLPECSARAPRYSQDNKYSSSLTKGSVQTRQSSNKISTSSSVRDRSAVYLSRAAAIDTTGGSTQPESVSTPGTRSKNSKFDSPAKDMCSACLTPVYPMEKMVANKLILHSNCFCCKHCQKKLSIHNYASLYGEFYCISHYQQLFKRTGNYDEGFGHMQHKDRWLQKNKVIDEPAVESTPKMTKSNTNTSVGSRESSAGVYVKHMLARKMVYKSGDEDKGKLKMSWPPEKKSPGFNPGQQTYVKKTISDIRRVSTAERDKSDNNQIKIIHGGEMKDKGGTFSSSFISGVNEQSKTTGYTVGEKLPSDQMKFRSDPIKDNVSFPGHNLFLPYLEKGNAVTQKNVAPTSKTNNQTFNTYQNKARKHVRFAPKVDVAQYVPSCQLTTEARVEEHSAQLSDQNKVNQSRDTEEGRDKNNLDQLSFESSREQHGSGVHLKIPENKHHGETSSSLKEREPVVEVESSREVPQTDIMVLKGPIGRTEESLDTQSFTDTLKFQDDMKHQEPCEVLHVIPRNSINPCESESLNTPHSLVEHMQGKDAGLGRNTNLFEKTESANDNDRQKKPVVRSNSLRGSAKQAEKTKVKLGSWSKGKSPLSKLFTSGGNNKTSKVEPKDVKLGGGLLGRLFQSSSEKVEDVTKSAAQDERNDKIPDDGKQTEELKEAVTKEIQKQGYTSQVPPREQKAGEDVMEESYFDKPNTMETNLGAFSKSTEPSNLHKPSSETGDDKTAPEQTNEHESDLQSCESTGLSGTDPGKATGSKDLPSTVSQASEESINQLIAETSGDDILSTPFNINMLVNTVSSAPDDLLAIQINTDVSAQKPNEVLDASDEGQRDLFDGTLHDLNREHPQDSSNPISPSDTFLSSVMDAAWPEAAYTDPFRQLDAHMIPAENDVMLDQLIVPASATVNQEEAPASSPSGTYIQTRQQVADFDIFGSDDTLFSQPPALEVPHQVQAFASSNQPSNFPEDIFGVSDVFTVLQSSPATSSSLNDLLGSETASDSAAHTGPFADDIVASEPQVLPESEPSDVNELVDSLLVSGNSSTKQTSESTDTNSSWMDDLLG